MLRTNTSLEPKWLSRKTECRHLGFNVRCQKTQASLWFKLPTSFSKSLCLTSTITEHMELKKVGSRGCFLVHDYFLPFLNLPKFPILPLGSYSQTSTSPPVSLQKYAHTKVHPFTSRSRGLGRFYTVKIYGTGQPQVHIS